MSLATAAPSHTVPYGQATRITVFFDDLDALGVLHNARYVVLLERALSAFWAQHGLSFQDGRPTSPDVVHAVREFTIEYLRPVSGTGEVDVHFWVQRLGSTSLVYGFRFVSTDGETVYARGTRSVVKLAPATFRPVPWTDRIRIEAQRLLADA